MAPRKFFKKKQSTKKRFVRKPKTNFKSKVPRDLVSMGLGFPSKIMVKQKYNDTLIMSSVSGSLTHQIFSLNSLYDPYFTGIGHQPMYFDQYMSIYNHFTVVGAKITIKVVPYENNLTPVIVCLWQNDDTTITPGGIENMAEQSKAKVYLLGDGGNAHKILTMNWSAKKTFGGSVLANPQLKGNSGASPAEQSYSIISLQSADRISNSNTCVQIDIEYISVYSEIRDISGS